LYKVFVRQCAVLPSSFSPYDEQTYL